MSLKFVELQIALPKTFEAGKISEQHQQQALLGQELASRAHQKQEARKRTSVSESSPTGKAKKEAVAHRTESVSQENNEKNSAKINDLTHPFAGHLVDFKG